MDHHLFGTSEFVNIRPLSQEDIFSLLLLRNQNRRWFFDQSIISSQQQLEWYQNYLLKKDDIMFSISPRDVDCFAGAGALYHITPGGAAEFGRLLVARELFDKPGMGCDITRAICDIGFERLFLKEIWLEVYEENIAARRTYERVGFCTMGEAEQRSGKSLLKMRLI